MASNFVKNRFVMLRSLLFYAFWFVPILIYAQDREISGVILDGSNDDPLSFANVLIKGTQTGTMTDLDGNFTFTNVPEDAVIVVSYIGYLSKEVQVTDDDFYTIMLMPDVQMLGDVVVIGYGRESRRNITGAVSQLSGELIESLDPPNVAQALQGTISGVHVTQQGGSPGSESNIRIRGISTNGNNAPLIIVDGFQFEGGLNSINPQDIESMTILKDAQAAIYGSAASNGVILITTKSGERNQDAQFTYQTYFGIQETSRKLPLLNATEYALLLNESYANAGLESPISQITGLGKGTNWQDEVFSRAPVMSHNLSVRGGSENTTYSISGSIFDQEGIVGRDKSQFNRKTASVALESDLRENLNLNTRLFYFSTTNNSLNSFGLGSVLFNALNMAPTIDKNVDDLTGEINLGNEVVNPLTQIRNTYNESTTNRLSGTFQLRYDYAPNLDIQARIGFNTSNTQNRDFFPVFNYGPGKVFNRLEDNQVTLAKINDNDYTFDLFNTYRNIINDRHDIIFTVGMTVFQQEGSGLFGTSTGVPANSFDFADLSVTTGSGDNLTASSYAYDVRRLSYFGRLQYVLDDRYLITGILRRDASTRFGPNNRVGYFPALSLGWVMSEEDWFPRLDYLDFFKFRGSYGVMGNDRIPDFLYLSLLTGQATYVSGDDGSLINGIAIGPLSNPNVKWEESRKLDIGFDIRFLRNKFNLVIDYYINDTENLLVAGIPISGILGTAAPGSSSPTINAGSVRNQGFEMEFTYQETLSENLNINLGLNFSTIKNEVTAIEGRDVLEGGQFGVGNLAPSRMEVGQPIGYFYGYLTDGIFQNMDEVNAHASQLPLGARAQPGDIRYVDVNGDGVIDENDRVYLGDPIPDFTFGFNVGLQRNNWDLSAYVFGSVGNDIVRNFERAQDNVNKMSYRLDRWTGEGTSNNVPRATVAPTANNVFSDFFIEDGSFVRIQTISLGYNFENDLISRIGLSQLRVYAKVDNVFTFTEYSGYDPTASTGVPIGGGIDFGFYPIPRVYMLGLNAQF